VTHCLPKLATLALTTSLGLFLAGQARAACTPDGVANNGVVTCTGDDTNGFTSSATGITVNVQSTATVTRGGGNDALRLNGAGNTVNNSGTVDGTDEGIDIRGANGTITNATTGLIRGADRGIDSDGVNGLTITNNGTITGTGSDAIRAANGITITNNLGATITGGDEGVQVLSGLTLTNHGTIDAADEGIEATDNATFVNTGTIKAVDDAIQSDDNTSITNSGLIESSSNDGIDIDTGSVVNTGIIRATAGEDGIDFDPDAANVVSTVDNRAGGLISGHIGINVDDANDRAQAITNAGTIRGLGGTALYLEDGNDSLTLLGTGIVDGLADFGAGTDIFALSGLQASLVGGGGLFDGGLDLDTLMFEVSLQYLVSIVEDGLVPGALSLSFRNADDALSTVRVTNFEMFAFSDGTYDKAAVLAAVPLPASALLLGGALAGLAGLRRRRRSA
jgi:hypothetical protein